VKNRPEVIEDWIRQVNEEATKELDKFEEGFMMSITNKFENIRWLSDREEEILERIYANKTS